MRYAMFPLKLRNNCVLILRIIKKKQGHTVNIYTDNNRGLRSSCPSKNTKQCAKSCQTRSELLFPFVLALVWPVKGIQCHQFCISQLCWKTTLSLFIFKNYTVKRIWCLHDFKTDYLFHGKYTKRLNRGQNYSSLSRSSYDITCNQPRVTCAQA